MPTAIASINATNGLFEGGEALAPLRQDFPGIVAESFGEAVSRLATG